LAVTWALPVEKEMTREEIVEYINNLEGNTWKAKVHPRFAGQSSDQIKMLLGALERDTNPRAHLFKIEPKSINTIPIPKEFDSRTKWPLCKEVIDTIVDQSACGSCWAVSSASVMSDRVCIGSNGKNKNPISANDLISCCYNCGKGCRGGYPDETFYTWVKTGVVTGSGYKLDAGCQPYPFPVCEHHNNKTTYPACQKDLYNTPSCKRSCQASYKTNTYRNDKTFGQAAVHYSRDVAGIQAEIMNNGPVVFTFKVYDDFESYSSGVYQHKVGRFLGGHAVRAIGWGEENGTPYWLIANSWNEDWGDKGYFKMIRGKNDCDIEKAISAAKFKN